MFWNLDLQKRFSLRSLNYFLLNLFHNFRKLWLFLVCYNNLLLTLLSFFNWLTSPQSEIFIKVICNLFLFNRSCWLIHSNSSFVEFICLFSIVILESKIIPYRIWLWDAHKRFQFLIDWCLRHFYINHREFFSSFLSQIDEDLIYISLLQKLSQILYNSLIFLFDLCFDLLLLGTQFKTLFFITS